MAENPIVTCPKCEKKFKPKTDVRGKRIRCPFCTESFVVPADEAASPTAIQAKEQPSQPAPAPAAATAGDEEAAENDNPYGVTKADLAPRCPNCAHEMESEDAVVCLNCGYNTLTREWGKTEKLIGVSFGRHFMHLLPGIIATFCVISCIIDRLMYSILLPFWVADANWINWNDHESLRMWSTMIGLSSIFPLGRYAYKRFIEKPIPPEAKMDD